MTDETDAEVSLGEGLKALAESVETAAILAAVTGSFAVAGGLAVHVYQGEQAGSGVTLAAIPGILLLVALGVWALVDCARDTADYYRSWRSGSDPEPPADPEETA